MSGNPACRRAAWRQYRPPPRAAAFTPDLFLQSCPSSPPNLSASPLRSRPQAMGPSARPLRRRIGGPPRAMAAANAAPPAVLVRSQQPLQTQHAGRHVASKRASWRADTPSAVGTASNCLRWSWCGFSGSWCSRGDAFIRHARSASKKPQPPGNPAQPRHRHSPAPSITGGRRHTVSHSRTLRAARRSRSTFSAPPCRRHQLAQHESASKVAHLAGSASLLAAHHAGRARPVSASPPGRYPGFGDTAASTRTASNSGRAASTRIQRAVRSCRCCSRLSLWSRDGCRRPPRLSSASMFRSRSRDQEASVTVGRPQPVIDQGFAVGGIPRPVTAVAPYVGHAMPDAPPSTGRPRAQLSRCRTASGSSARTQNSANLRLVEPRMVEAEGKAAPGDRSIASLTVCLACAQQTSRRGRGCPRTGGE